MYNFLILRASTARQITLASFFHVRPTWEETWEEEGKKEKRKKKKEKSWQMKEEKI